jgi:DNA replication and repair protein RecF
MQGSTRAPRRPALTASLERLEARSFRNFADLRCEFPEAGAFIVGPNGSGKTNLIEAIYYLEIFRSFRGARDAELIRFGEDVFRVEGTVRNAAGSVSLAAAYQRSGRRKKVEVEGRESGRLADALGSLGAVVFSLDDAELVYGSPGRRRRFLDILLSLVRPGYLASLQRYRAVLAQRNEALRQGADTVVQAWTEGLVEPGARLMADREAWIAQHDAGFREYHATASGGATASLAYEPALGGDQAYSDAVEAGPGRPVVREAEQVYSEEPACSEHWAEQFRRSLAESAERDRRRRSTQVGPHRDDLVIRAEVDGGETERDLRSYGSGGQQRTAAIALRLVEADTLQDKLGREPLYLLDDVFAELDEERASRVLRLLDEGRSGQVLLTAPKPADVPLRGGGLPRWRIEDGTLVTDG